MLKFELARKYLVGFLTLAMVLSLFALPVAADVGPIVNAVYATTVSAPDYPGTTSPTYPLSYVTTLTINLLNGGVLVDPPTTATMYIYDANVTGSKIVATKDGVGTWTATWMSATATVIPFVAFLDAAGTGVPNPAYPPSDNEYAEWATSVYGITFDPNIATNPELTVHTITITVKDQFGVGLPSGTVTTVVNPGINQTKTVTSLVTNGTATATYLNDDSNFSGTAESLGVKGHDHITVTGIGGITATGTKVWTYTPTWDIDLIPTTATNPTTNGVVAHNTHTVTASVEDQYDNHPPLSSTVTFAITGTHPQTLTGTTNASGVASVTYTGTRVGFDYITASYGGFFSNTATKEWQARALSSVTLTNTANTEADRYNMVGTTHYVRVKPVDQFRDTYTGTTFTGTLQVVWHDTVTLTRYIPFTGTGTIDVPVPAYMGGWDQISLIALTPAITLPTNILNKFWAYEYNVGPLEEINILGSPHDFVIKGAPFQHFNGQLYQNDLGLIKITGFQGGIYPGHGVGLFVVPTGQIGAFVDPAGPESRFASDFTLDGYLDSTGSATITVYGKSPYKFYLEVNFGNTYTPSGYDAAQWPGWDITVHPYDLGAFPRTVTETNWQVAKIYAKITRFTLTPTYDLNTITTSTGADTHEVSVMVWGKYYWYGEWSAEFPVGGAKVDWTVNYSDAFDRNYVSSTVDLGGNPTLDIPNMLKATSYTDATGLATLKYSLVTTPSFHIWPLFDHITANVHYSDLVLDTDYPPPDTQTVTKEWRDYGFKLYKVVNNDYTQTLTNVTFFLKTATGTFFYLPGNASVAQPDLYTVKTDTYGAAVWYHLPNGTYDVYEIVPAGYVGAGTTIKVHTFTVPGIEWWHGNGTLYTTYISNTPTTDQPRGELNFWKWRMDGGYNPDTNTFVSGTPTVFKGVLFTLTKPSDGTYSKTAVSSSTGWVHFAFTASDLDTGTNTTWFCLTETASAGYLPVPTFYFYLDNALGVHGYWSQATASSTYVVDPFYLGRTGTIMNFKGQVQFNKLTYCFQNLPDAQFTFSNADAGTFGPYTSSSTGLVSSGLLPVVNSATTWYTVHETSVPVGYLAVSDFYFYLTADGNWNGHFYIAADETSAEVWPWSPRPEVGTLRHWVIDQAAQAAVVTTIVVDPASGTYNFATQTTLTVTVTVKDQLGNGMQNRAVTPVITGNASLNTATITTNILGKATFILTATTTGPVIFSVTVDTKTGLGNYLWTSSALALNDLAATPSVDVATWNPVTISANSPLSGTWSGKIYTPLGVEIGTLAGATGMNFSATWAPLLVQNFVGDGYYAVVNLTDGITTLTDTVFFSVYNYQIKITGVALLDASWTPITNPTAGQAFYVKVDIKNMFTGVVASAFVPVMIDFTYVGAGGLGGLISGQTGSAYILCTGLTAGAHTGYAYVWVDTGGTPIALPITFAITVNP